MQNVPVAAQQPRFLSSPLQTSQSTAERASTNDWLIQRQAQQKPIISSPSKHGQDEDKRNDLCSASAGLSRLLPEPQFTQLEQLQQP